MTLKNLLPSHLNLQDLNDLVYLKTNSCVPAFLPLEPEKQTPPKRSQAALLLLWLSHNTK